MQNKKQKNKTLKSHLNQHFLHLKKKKEKKTPPAWKSGGSYHNNIRFLQPVCIRTFSSEKFSCYYQSFSRS